ncbi:sensor histidine kinase, partial [Lacticaseibacillus paracasei]|nr:sensor histidine kinase [Lacticaseibacillus paracasei]
MNAEKGIKHQQRRLFIGQLLSFAGLFVVLGIIVFFLYERSIYQDIDHTLEQQQAMILNPNEETTKLGPQQPGTRVTHPAPFRTNMVVFNQKGRIINQAMLGERFYAYFKNLKLDRSAQNKLQTLTTSTGTFRTLLIKAPKYSADPQYAG